MGQHGSANHDCGEQRHSHHLYLDRDALLERRRACDFASGGRVPPPMTVFSYFRRRLRWPKNGCRFGGRPFQLLEETPAHLLGECLVLDPLKCLSVGSAARARLCDLARHY